METGVMTLEGQGTDAAALVERQEIDRDLWLSKDEAAALLGVQTRQIERREAAGQLRKRTLPREPGQTTARVAYSRSDLLALKAGAPNDYREPGREVISQKSDTPVAPPSAGPAAHTALGSVDVLASLLQRLAPVPASEPRPWLTLDEAAEYSGLPAAWLLKSAQAGYVGAIDLGGRPRGGRWRFRRADLARIGA